MGRSFREVHYASYNRSVNKRPAYIVVRARPIAAKLLEMEELQKQLGDRIRRLRLKKGYTQESFADLCGLHRNFMGSVERGEQNVTLRSLHTIAAGLGTTIAKLLAGLG